jgi:hypothetical protein
MKKTIPFLLVVLLTGLIISCHKESQPNNEQTFDSITFGNYEGMDVFTYDSIDWELDEFLEGIGYYGGITVGGKTISLKTMVLSNPYNGNPLDCYEISIGAEDDFTFHNKRINYNEYEHVDSTIIQTDSVTLIYVDGITSCYQISESDQHIGSTVMGVLAKHDKNDVLTKKDFTTPSTWSNYFYKPLFISNAECQIQIAYESINAIVYESYINAASECLNFPLDEPFFLGFKCTDELGERLGWIKLIIEPNADGYYIPKPLEASIQKQQTI